MKNLFFEILFINFQEIIFFPIHYGKKDRNCYIIQTYIITFYKGQDGIIVRSGYWNICNSKVFNNLNFGIVHDSIIIYFVRLR
jgi:hypothetical protein